MKELSKKYNTNVICPTNSVVSDPAFKDSAYTDEASGTNFGFMNCFCSYKMTKTPLTFTKITFAPLATGTNATRKFCEEWFHVYLIN